MSRNVSSHLERTADVARSETTSEASVEEVQDISQTVKALKLKIKNNQLSFKAGQWVDFSIPNVDVVGGFSMYTSPKMLEESRILGLAVKYSNHPPAQWVHKQCNVGDVVSLKVGGDCFWDPKVPTFIKNTLLIAGGIGINPIFSILQHIEESRAMARHNNSQLENTILLYSASNRDELIFKDDVKLLSNYTEKLSCQFYSTKEQEGVRISEEDVSNAVKELSKNNQSVQCFLCGPPPMIKSMIEYLKKAKVATADIHYEKWW